MPRVIGLAVSIFSLTVYMIIVALLSGLSLRLPPGRPAPAGRIFQPARQLTALGRFRFARSQDRQFRNRHRDRDLLPGARPALTIEEVRDVTTSAVVESVICCVLLDALFIIVYLII
jgi:hypothetical protein